MPVFVRRKDEPSNRTMHVLLFFILLLLLGIFTTMVVIAVSLVPLANRINYLSVQAQVVPSVLAQATSCAIAAADVGSVSAAYLPIATSILKTTTAMEFSGGTAQSLASSMAGISNVLSAAKGFADTFQNYQAPQVC